MWERNHGGRGDMTVVQSAEEVSVLGQGSKSQRSKREPAVYKISISVLLLLLSLEWIYPITSSGQQGSGRFLTVMAGLTGALLMAGLLRTGWMLGIALRLLVALTALCLMYGGSDPAGWALGYPETWMEDIRSFMESGHFYSISTETRGLLMMCGWSMLMASVQSLVLMRRSVMLFGSATLLYLLLLETLAGLDVYASVVRSVLWILLIQTILQLLRLLEGAQHQPFTDIPMFVGVRWLQLQQRGWYCLLLCPDVLSRCLSLNGYRLIRLENALPAGQAIHHAAASLLRHLSQDTVHLMRRWDLHWYKEMPSFYSEEPSSHVLARRDSFLL